MDQVHVQPVALQPGQAGVDLAQDVAAREAAVVGTIAHGVEHLGAEEDLIPHAGSLLLEPGADEGLAPAPAIGVGGVEEVDAGLEGAVHQRERVPLVLALAVELRRRTDAAEVPAAQPEAGDPEAGRSQSSILHAAPRTHGSTLGPRARGYNMAPSKETGRGGSGAKAAGGSGVSGGLDEPGGAAERDRPRERARPRVEGEHRSRRLRPPGGRVRGARRRRHPESGGRVLVGSASERRPT